MSEVKSILLVGVGGQGTILVSKILTAGLVQQGYDVKMSEVHGMAQRGGSVSTQVRYGTLVHSPIIGKGQADMLVAFEKMEAVRYAGFLKPGGTAIVNDYEIIPMGVSSGQQQYPHNAIQVMQQAFHTVTLKAADIAIGLGNAKCMNVVLFGAMVKVLGMESIHWEDILRQLIPEKLLALNLNAFKAGLQSVGNP